MSTFDDNERSTSQNRPVDLYTIATPSQTYHLTSHPVDVDYSGDTYFATTMSRGPEEVSQDPVGRELLLSVPISHPVVQRFAAVGIPEQTVAITHLRLQTVSGVAIQGWVGFATALSVSGNLATLRVPAATDDALKIKLPIFRGQRLCNHRLYDAGCTLNRDGLNGPNFAFRLDTTVVSQAASTVHAGAADLVVASAATPSGIGGSPAEWATFGEVYNSVGEARQILFQSSTTLTINAPFVGIVAGATVTIYAGCGHTMVACRDLFANVPNYGGHPHINPKIDPWANKGLGVIQQP